MKKWTDEENQFLIENFGKLSKHELAQHFGVGIGSIEHRFRNFNLKPEKSSITAPTADELVARDRDKRDERSETKLVKEKYRLVMADNERLNREIQAILRMKDTPQSLVITPTTNGGSEATAFVVASDWHVEESVRPEQVSGLNTFDLKVADSRITKFFTNSIKLLNITQRDSHIKEMVLCLLGDFISGSIHEELVEGNNLLPIDAIMFAEQRIYAGIQAYLKNTNLNITVVCHAGNHSRITQKTHFANEQGNSLEFYMYHHLKQLFEKNKRVRFVIATGYHTYLDIYGHIIRLHHGHTVRYGGGVGGIYIPVNKAIAQWNKGRRCDLDVFGHFHQLRDGGNFVCNGSLIGYNSFALSIKADFEPAKQAFFLVDKKRGKTLQAPIWLD